MRNLHGSRFRGATAIVASPPCTEFSFATVLRTLSGGPPRNPAKGMPLVRETFRIIREANPTWYTVENVRGAVDAISREFGRPRATHGAWILWGNFPGFIAPVTRKMNYAAVPAWVPAEGRKAWKFAHGSNRKSRDPHLSSMIPYALAKALAEACLP